MAGCDERVLRALVELADTFGEDFDVVGHLGRLAECAAGLLSMASVASVASVAVVLTGTGGSLHCAAATDGRARLLGGVEAESGQGAAVACLRSGREARFLAGQGPADWPLFAAAAGRSGARAAVGLPLRHRERVLGGLGLYADSEAALAPDPLRVLRAFAEVTAIGVLREQSARHQARTAEQLRTALANRVAIEQAKGFLAHRLSTTPDAAFELLRSSARSRGQRLTDLATAVLHTPPDAPLPLLPPA
ncbi:ANTAR domain-containing protein [Kitasatospora sp. NPDC004289]